MTVGEAVSGRCAQAARGGRVALAAAGRRAAALQGARRHTRRSVPRARARAHGGRGGGVRALFWTAASRASRWRTSSATARSAPSTSRSRATCSSRAPRRRRSSTWRWRSSSVLPLAGPDPEDEPLAIDVGTGSGCVALALAAEDPFVRVVATDVDPGALAVARGNAARLGLARRVEFVLSDLFHDVGERPVRPRRQQPAVHPRRRVRGARAQRAGLRAAAGAVRRRRRPGLLPPPRPRRGAAAAAGRDAGRGGGSRPGGRRRRHHGRRPGRSAGRGCATTSPACRAWCPRTGAAEARCDGASPDSAA